MQHILGGLRTITGRSQQQLLHVQALVIVSTFIGVCSRRAAVALQSSLPDALPCLGHALRSTATMQSCGHNSHTVQRGTSRTFTWAGRDGPTAEVLGANAFTPGAANMSSAPAAGVVLAALRIACVSGLHQKYFIGQEVINDACKRALACSTSHAMRDVSEASVEARHAALARSCTLFTTARLVQSHKCKLMMSSQDQ